MEIKTFINKSLSELGQVYPIKFAFANIDTDNDCTTAVMPMVVCRDFLLDVVYVNRHPKVISKYTIYGMRYSYTTDALHPDKVGLIVTFTDNQQVDNFKTLLYVLHKIEEYNQLEKTYIVCEDNNTVVLRFDPKIATTCITINLYTMIIKFLAFVNPKATDIYHELNSSNYESVPAEVGYLNTVTPDTFEFLCQNIWYILSKCSDLYANGANVPTTYIYEIHTASGIVSLDRNMRFNREDSGSLSDRLRMLRKDFSLTKHIFTLNRG